MVRDKWEFPKGFCYIDNRGSFEDVIQVVENIPEDLMPPSFKKAEDFVRNVMKITQGHSAPYDKKIKDVCKYGQTSEEAIKDFDLHKARLAIEFALDGGNWRLKKIKHLLDPNFYDEWIVDKIPSRNQEGTFINKLHTLASDVYNSRREDYKDDKIEDIITESEMLYDMIQSEDNKEKREALWKERDIISKKVSKAIEDKKQHIKDEIHNRSVERWYDKFAWDFDKEERKKLKNPYI
ncbi:MAG: hypothetical protein GY870_12655 [archaeon]|nr:hypothetical protein [archaeon]